MKPKSAREVGQLLRSDAFASWYRRYSELHEGAHAAALRRDDFLAQASMSASKADNTEQQADEAVLAAGGSEDDAAIAAAEFSEVENDSFEALSAFENQRTLASECWVALESAQKTLEDQRQQSSDLRALLSAIVAQRRLPARTDVEALQAELDGLGVSVRAQARVVETAQARLDSELDRRAKLWRGVEAAWTAAFTANMRRAEHTYQARRWRRQAERLHEQAHAERGRIDVLKSEAERAAARFDALTAELRPSRQEAEQAFGATLIEEFLYWPRRDDVHMALCVPLIDERNDLNIQVVALQVYQVERDKGLDFIEPVSAGGDGDEDDPRLDTFFTVGKPTAVRG